MQDKVVGYTSHLATVGRDLLAEELGLDRLDIPPSMEAPNLRMLKLPGVPQSCSGIKDKRVRSRTGQSRYGPRLDSHVTVPDYTVTVQTRQSR